MLVHDRSFSHRHDGFGDWWSALFVLFAKKTTAILLAPNPHVAKPAAVQSNRESAIQNILPTV
jgi:hypothetical protein